MLTLTHLTGFGAGGDATGAGGGNRFFRLAITKTVAADTDIDVGDFRLLVGSTAYPTVNMTGNSAPAPLVASASSVQNQPYLSFDTAVGGGWASGANTVNASTGACNEWLQIDLGAGNGIVPTGCSITPRASTRFLVDFAVLGSPDGSSWTTLFSTAGQTAGWTANTARTFVF